MRRTLLKAILANLLVAMGSVSAKALPPALFFSDIVSGPNTGNGDGLGSGAIVTIWGANLGSSQGTSSVQVGGVKTDHVYCWGNADGTFNSGTCGGPAKLYNGYQKMQAISFSVPAGAVNGANTISVTVNGVASNTLPFTVRAGRICYIKTTGSDTGANCSFASPWRTLSYVANGPTLQAGDIIYVMDGVQELSGFAMHEGGLTAAVDTATAISFVAYPGATVMSQQSAAGYSTIGNWSSAAQWINIVKFTLKTNGNGIDSMKGMRVIANEITNYPGGCAVGQGGAISNSKNGTTDGGVKALGNYIHDFGCSTTIHLHHTFYLSNRSGTSYKSYELGWNYLRDNGVSDALHNYDENVCGDWSGPMLWHDNVIINQTGAGIELGAGSNGTTGVCMSMPLYIYNNLFINNGLDPMNDGHNNAVDFGGASGSITSNIYVYNNTWVGWGDPTYGGDFLYIYCPSCPMTIDWRNNMVVDSLNRPYMVPPPFGNPLPAVHSNNLWYSSFGQPAPSWDTAPITSNPLLINPVIGGDYSLLVNSPAVDAGANLSSTVTRDILGTLRPQGAGFDIGAYEYVSGGVTLTAPPAAPRGFRLQ